MVIYLPFYSQMIAPTKEFPAPRNWAFRECEKVMQDDGNIAVFFYDSKLPDDGWVFSHLEDKWGFISMADQYMDFADTLLAGECDEDHKLKSTGRHYLAPAKDPEPLSVEESDRRWGNFILPIIENIVPGADILTSLLSVQPMTGPVDSVMEFEVINAEQSHARKITEFEHFSQALGTGELLKQYAYGGVMSGRGGYFIVHKDAPNTILRYQQTWLS